MYFVEKVIVVIIIKNKKTRKQETRNVFLKQCNIFLVFNILHRYSAAWPCLTLSDSACSNVKQEYWGNQTLRVQEQPFADVLQNKYCWKFGKVAVLKVWSSIKNIFQQRWFFWEYYKIFQNRFFHRAPPVTALRVSITNKDIFCRQRKKLERLYLAIFRRLQGISFSFETKGE